MEAIAKLLNGKGNIAIMNGQMGQDAQIKRTEGNKQVIEKNPGGASVPLPSPQLARLLFLKN